MEEEDAMNGEQGNTEEKADDDEKEVDTEDGVMLLMLLLSVDLHIGWSEDNICIPAIDLLDGKSFQSGESPFGTCYQNKYTEEKCWSKSYLSDAMICGKNISHNTNNPLQLYQYKLSIKIKIIALQLNQDLVFLSRNAIA